MYEKIEKRIHKRIEKPFIVKFQAVSDRPDVRIPPDWDMVVTKDMGAGGVYFYSSRNFVVGTLLDMRIGFSTSKPPIECIGKVVRVKEQPHTSIFGVATAFTKIDEQEKQLIDESAENFLSHENHYNRPVISELM